ncbi:MAG TPA: ATP-binding protein [Acidimicrobiales bacterium]
MEPQGAGRRNIPLLTAISSLVGTGLLLIAIAIAALEPEGSYWRTASIVNLALGAVILALLLSREISQRRRSERAFARTSHTLGRLGHPVDDAIGDLSFQELLDELAGRARTSLDAAWAALLLSGGEHGALQVAAATPDAPRQVGTATEPDTLEEGMYAGRCVVQLPLESGLFGLLELGEADDHPFEQDDLALVRLVGDRIAVEIERARLADAERRSRLGAIQARSHLALIAEVSIELARAIEDVRPAMREVADILIDGFAELCTIHLAGPEGRIERVVGRACEAGNDLITNLAGDLPGTQAAIQRVMATGKPELTYVDAAGRVRGVKDEFSRSLHQRGMKSWVMAAIRVRGLPLGAIVVATGPSRRGYRPSDQAVVDELANRIAIAVERSLLYSDMHQAGLAAERRAEQLSRLIEAAIALDPSSTPSELLHTLVEQAAQVLQAPRAHAWLSGDDALEAEYGTAPSYPVRSGSPLVDSTGQDAGFLSVTRSETEPFTAADDAVLTLLARLASAAVQNARLYGDLHVRELRLQALFEASPLAILELDVRGVVRKTNPAALALFGTDDRPDAIELPHALQDRLGLMTVKALAGDVAESELTTDVDGRELDLWISTAPIRGHEALPSGVLAVVSDTTERQRLREQLADAHRYEAIAQLAGGVAHDFNNLLTIILGYGDLLLQKLPAGSVEHDDVTAIHQAGQHAAVITNQLLTLSRNQVVQPIVVEVAATGESLLPMLRRLAGENVDVQLESHTHAAIRMDAGQLEQVLFNLVLNSRDAMPDGGMVKIDAAETTTETGPDVTLTVSDTGVGMDPDTIDRCLEPFFTTKGRRGIGLGLATVSTIVQRAGGTLDITSSPGEGTSISIRLPIEQTIPSRSEPPPLRPQGRVLLVDDDGLVRRFASKALSEAGYEVTSVDDADTALTVARADGNFDLVVSDVVLPGMTGLELVRIFGTEWPSVARLLMTGFAGTETKGTDLETVRVLKKPFAVDELTRAAHDALEAARALPPTPPGRPKRPGRAQGSKR